MIDQGFDETCCNDIDRCRCPECREQAVLAEASNDEFASKLTDDEIREWEQNVLASSTRALRQTAVTLTTLALLGSSRQRRRARREISGLINIAAQGDPVTHAIGAIKYSCAECPPATPSTQRLVDLFDAALQCRAMIHLSSTDHPAVVSALRAWCDVCHIELRVLPSEGDRIYRVDLPNGGHVHVTEWL